MTTDTTTKLAKTAPTPNLHALEQRLLSIRLNRDSAESLLRERSFDLAGDPDNKALQADVDALEREIAGHEKERRRTEAAILELGRRSSAKARRERLATLSDHHGSVMKSGRQMARLAEKIVANIEALGPLLSEYASLSDTRRELARQVLKGGSNYSSAQWYSLEEAASWRSNVVSPAIAAALWRAGLGRLGPRLDAWVEVSPPHADSQFAKGDLLAVLRSRIERADESLSMKLKQSIDSATHEVAQQESGK